MADLSKGCKMIRFRSEKENSGMISRNNNRIRKGKIKEEYFEREIYYCRKTKIE